MFSKTSYLISPESIFFSQFIDKETEAEKVSEHPASRGKGLKGTFTKHPLHGRHYLKPELELTP